MTQLVIEQNQISYTGNYTKPPFQLWGQGGSILSGLCSAFAPFGVSLANLRVEGAGSQSPLDQAVIVAFGTNGVYRFRFDKLESTFANFSEQELEMLPLILAAGEGWLRKAVPELEFQSHQIQYGSHSRVSEGTVDELLRRVVRANLEIPGGAVKAGVILKWNEPENGWIVQMTLDQSQFVENGLFLWFGVTISSDHLDFPEVAGAARVLLDKRLGQFDIAIPKG
jgi:hypothetical protein